jgi:hypothetical protein
MLEEHQASMPPQAQCEPHGHAMLWLQFPWIFVPFYPLMRFTLRHGKREFCTISLYVYNLYIYILCVCIYIYVHLYSHFVHMIRLRSYLHSDDLGQVAPPSVKVSDAEAESKDQPWSWHGDIVGSSINGRQLNN